MARRRLRRDAKALFQDAHGDLLRFNEITLFHGGLIGAPCFDSFSFRFRKTVACEKVLHFSFRCHHGRSSADEEKTSANARKRWVKVTYTVV